MKKTIGFIALLITMSISSFGQINISKNAKDIHKNVEKDVNGKVNEIKGKTTDIKDAKKKEIRQHNEVKTQAKQLSQAAKTKYLSMKKEDIEALPIAQKAEAKKAIIEKKVNTSDMKSASAQMKIAGVKTRLKQGLKDGTISESEYQEKMKKVTHAEASLKAYRTSIKQGKKLLK